MCRSGRDGGRRCAAHTRPGFHRALSAVSAAAATGAQDRISAAFIAHTQPATVHACTPKGAREVAEALHQATASHQTVLADFLTHVQDRAARQTQQAQAVEEHLTDARTHHNTSTYSSTTQPSPFQALAQPETHRRIVDHVRANGGLTIDPSTGTEPTSGYCINAVGACPKIPEDQFFSAQGSTHVAEFLEGHADWFTGPNASHVGFWHDKANRVVVLDRVDVIGDRDTALQVGRSRSQRSIWDVESQQEIHLC